MLRQEAPQSNLNDTTRQTTPSGKSQKTTIITPRASNLQEAEDKGSASPYEEWSKHDLCERAVEHGIEGRARMSKKDLINTLRDY